MKKDNIEKQVKIIGIGIILAGLSLLMLDIYSIYCVGAVQKLSDLYYLLFGSLFLIVGFGLVKFRSWARKMMLYTMAVYLAAGIYGLFGPIGIILFPIIDNIKIDYHLWIYAILALVMAFVVMFVLPAVGIFYFLNNKEIKSFFQKKNS